MALDLQKATQKPVISFILASSSPRRKELLSDLIQDFYVKNAEVNELDIHPDGPKYLVLENAKLKCEEIAKSFPDFWVLGADTLVALGSKIFSKPKDLQEAKAILMQLSGKTHKVFTGVSLITISKDINLRLKADVLGLNAEDYGKHNVTLDELYSGNREIGVSNNILMQFEKIVE